MREIQPVTLWVNGESKVATKFNLKIVFDDLSTSCTFYYELLSEVEQEVGGQSVFNNVLLANGNSELKGEEYEQWGDSGDINDEAYVLIADKLNLTLV